MKWSSKTCISVNWHNKANSDYLEEVLGNPWMQWPRPTFAHHDTIPHIRTTYMWTSCQTNRPLIYFGNETLFDLTSRPHFQPEAHMGRVCRRSPQYNPAKTKSWSNVNIQSTYKRTCIWVMAYDSISNYLWLTYIKPRSIFVPVLFNQRLNRCVVGWPDKLVFKWTNDP